MKSKPVDQEPQPPAHDHDTGDVRAGAKTPEPPTGRSVDRSAARQNRKPQKAAKQAANEAKTELGTPRPPTEQEQRLLDLEAVVTKSLLAVFEAGKALREIRDAKLYRVEFATFESYCTHRWGMNRSRCYQLMDAAEVQRNLSTRVDIVELTEKHCRELVKLKDTDQVTAWNAAAAPDGKVTLVDLKQAVAKLRPPVRPPVPNKTESPAAFDVEAVVVAPDDTLPARPVEGAATTGQAETLAVADSAPGVSAEFDLEIEWSPIEASLNSLLRRCPPDKWPDFWRKLNGFALDHPELIPAQDR